MSEANMLVKINEAITEETIFDNSPEPGAGGTIYYHEVTDTGARITMFEAQGTLVHKLISEFGIVPSQKAKFFRFAYNRIVELKKTR